MKLSSLVYVGLLAVALCPPSFAQQVSPERAAAIGQQVYASKNVTKLLAAAKALRRMDPIEDARLQCKVDPTSHPRPYGTPDTSQCAFEIEASYGWYADPVLLVTVKGFVAKSKVAAGPLTEKDFEVREFSFRIPDPTGLE